MTNEEILQQAKDQVAQTHLNKYKDWNALCYDLRSNGAGHIIAYFEGQAARMAIQIAREEGYSLGHSEALAGDGL